MISIEQPPSSLDDDVREYLTRMFNNVGIAVGNNQQMTPQTIIPLKPADGKIYYFPVAVAPDITSVGYWGYVNGVWIKLDNSVLNNAIVELVPSGYGGGGQGATIPFEIPAGYITLPFDTLNPLVGRGVTFDPANNQFTYTTAGVWQLLVNFSIEDHNSVNSGRRFNVRLYNVTKSIAGVGMTVGIGRNQLDTYFSSSFLETVDASEVGDLFRVELGGSSTVTGGNLVAAGIQTTHVSELGLLV